MKRLSALLLLLPLVFAYQVSDYTGGNVYIPPGQVVTLNLPFPEGNNCQPVVVLFVKGGYDYPEINVNGQSFVGGGMHRAALEKSPVVKITLESNLPAELEGNSLIYCTRDPFILIKNVPPQPVLIGNYNFQTIVLKNAGYRDANVDLTMAFHPNFAPYYPPYKHVSIPARKILSYTLFGVGSPRFSGPAAHGEVCVDYNDSVMHVHYCTRPIPGRHEVRPLITCLDDECINSSNIVLESNGMSFGPGYTISRDDLAKFSEYNLEIKEINVTTENEPMGGESGLTAWVFIILGSVMLLGKAVGFI